ncbi:MAG: transcriptional regulator [Candidatus Poribacteria bacterium]|nr:transcriptional regulator [Candidatus Poribacteria bacterium]
MSHKQATRDAVEIIDRIHFKDDPKMRVGLEYERLKMDIGQKIYDLRNEAGLTHEHLADKVGTTAAVIDNLEETDYEDHQFGEAVLILRQVAKVLGKRVEVEFRVIPEAKG